MSSIKDATSLVFGIIKDNPGCARADIDGYLSYHETPFDEGMVDDAIGALLNRKVIVYNRGRYYPVNQSEEPVPKVFSGLAGGRIPSAVRVSGHFLWTASSYNLETLRKALQSLGTGFTSIDAELVPESNSQVRIKFSFLDSTNREMLYSSGTVATDSFFVLTTVAFTTAIPRFLVAAMKAADPDLEPLTELLPLYAMVYMSLYLLELAIRRIDPEAVLTVDDFTVVNVSKE